MQSARSFGVRNCICRVEKQLLGEACDKPIQNCLVFHPADDAFARSKTIRTITGPEAMDVLCQAADAGLVYSSANVQQGHGYMCNCCTCCCGILRGLSEFGNEDAMARAAFLCAVDVAACTGCQICHQICPFGAISTNSDGKAQILSHRCMGCGLCVPEYPDKALALIRRPEGTVAKPPVDEGEWLIQRARDRGIALEAVL